MKKFFVSVLFLVFASSAFAGHGPAGCGLGSILFKDKKGLLFNVLAATFNGSSGNQTIGMTVGSLGCEDAKDAKVAAVPFINGNFAAFAADISKGEGETLNAYLYLINKPSSDKKVLQANFDRIFSSSEPAKIHAEILELI